MAALFGRYEYVSELGRGSGSRVLKVRDLAEQGAERALKIVGPDEGARLSWELSRLSEVDHPNVARVRELLRVEQAVHVPFALLRGAWVLVEDLAQGQAADAALESLREEPRALLSAVFRVALGTAEALTALHRAGLVHGDVKPANVLVTPGAKQVTLIDLGVSRVPGFYPLIQGTPDYLAPEVWAGTCSFAQDTYALGATLLDLIEGGQNAWPSQGGAAPWRVRDLSVLPRELPAAFTDLLRRMLSVEPDSRPSDAMRLLSQLHAVGRRLHLGVPRSAAIYATGRVAPSAAELAARALSSPFIGHSGLRQRLVGALDAGGLVCVTGAPGAGRTRLIRESVRALQLSCAERGQPTPTLLSDLQAAQRIEVSRAIVHQAQAQPEHVELAQRSIEAWRRVGRTLSVVLEADFGALELSRTSFVFELQPLAADDERALLREVLGHEPGPEVQAAAHAASAGYAGRLCILLSQGLSEGRSLLVADEWSDLTLGDAGLGALSPPALRLLRILALSSGSLSQEAVGRLLGGELVVRHARQELRARGLLIESEEAQGAVHDDVARHVRERLGSDAHGLAREVQDELPLDHGALWVRVLCDGQEGGERAALSAAERIRARGEPYAVRALLREVLVYLDREPLRVQLADAQRALGRYGEAMQTLTACVTEPALLLHAEVARLRGDLAQANALLRAYLFFRDAALRERAQVLLARVAFDAGDFETAAAHLVDLPNDTLARVRAHETRALLALRRGEPATDEIAQLLTSARQLADARSLSRALMLSAQVSARQGRFGRAADELREAQARSRDAGEAHEAATITMNLGLVELDAGELGAALSTLRRGAAALVWLGREGELARALYNLGNAAWLVGDVALAEASYAEARERASSDRDPTLRAFLSIAEAEVALHHGELEAAHMLLQGELTATDLSDDVRAFLGFRAVCATLAAGHGDLAQRALENLLMCVLNPGPLLHVELAVAHARVLGARGSAQEAEAVMRDALLRLTGLPYEAHLRLLFAGIDTARAAGLVALSEERALACRALLERTLATLEPEARAMFRALPAHARALGQGGAHAAPSQERQDGAARRLVLAARRLFEATSEQRLARLIAQIALELLPSERAVVITQAADGSAHVLASASLGTAEILPFSRSIVERVWAEMMPLVTIDALHDARLDAAQSVHALGVRSVIAVPLRAFGGRAVIYLDDRLRPSAFGAHDRELLSDFAELAAAAARVVSAVKVERRAARQAQKKVKSLEAQLARHEPAIEGAPLIGESRALKAALTLASRVARTNTPVLIHGESGTGKELLARFIHKESDRHDRPFVAESCAALPEGLLESALFGHERGAFTGADRARVGLFELAHTGTLFLDEVGEMSQALQAKLLRVLQDGEVRPVGSEKTRHVEVRLLTATHRNLAALVESGRFREDLFYRVSVITIDLPPLRERLEDIPLLVSHFLAKHATRGEARIKPMALDVLMQRAWPGNVRQLESEIQRALALSEGVIGVEHLTVSSAEPQLSGLDLRSHTDALQRQLVRRALEEAQGNQTRAAELLGISRFGLQKMLKRLGLD